MIEYKNIRSTVKPENKVIDDYSVWVNTDIKEVDVKTDEEIHTEFEFNQVRYTKDEYINLIDNKNTELEKQVTNTQLALCDVYEMIGS